jgi:hypothetical protein
MANMSYAGGGGSVVFPFAANFPGLIENGNPLTSSAIDAACVAVETEWAGIFSLFSTFSAALQTAKQNLLEAYLVGWWLMDMYPTKTRGMQGDGGMPLTGKSIGGVSISRKDLEAQPALKQLESNAFGVKALSMIMSAPERAMLYGQTRSGFKGQGWVW